MAMMCARKVLAWELGLRERWNGQSDLSSITGSFCVTGASWSLGLASLFSAACSVLHSSPSEHTHTRV